MSGQLRSVCSYHPYGWSNPTTRIGNLWNSFTISRQCHGSFPLQNIPSWSSTTIRCAWNYELSVRFKTHKWPMQLSIRLCGMLFDKISSQSTTAVLQETTMKSFIFQCDILDNLKFLGSIFWNFLKNFWKSFFTFWKKCLLFLLFSLALICVTGMFVLTNHCLI